jgi:beta-glucosidase
MRQFPEGFLWGASTAGHQVEGNNSSSDLWLLEQLPVTVFKEPSGIACNSYELWETDLDVAASLGLNAYRFSVEWARVEPERGVYSQEALDHYAAIVDGCRVRGLEPVVTYNHFVAPLWFTAGGGWLAAGSDQTFADYCTVVTKALGHGMTWAMTMNEPNIRNILDHAGLPHFLHGILVAMLQGAEEKLGVEKFRGVQFFLPEDADAMRAALAAGHIAGRAAIKAVAPHAKVGLGVAMMDDVAIGDAPMLEQKRRDCYETWFELAKDDDFVGVQNYSRALFGPQGLLPPPAGSPVNQGGEETYPPSLANCVLYAREQTGVPVFITEHGLSTTDDRRRAEFIPASLAHLHDVIEAGVPVIGYCHWSLLDNYEWVAGYGPKFGLVEVDEVSFVRTPKPSARVYGAIAQANGV